MDSTTTELRGVLIELDRKRNNLGGLGGGLKLQLRLNEVLVPTTSGRFSFGTVLSSKKGGNLICFRVSRLVVRRSDRRCQNLHDGWRLMLLPCLSLLLLFVGFASSDGTIYFSEGATTPWVNTPLDFTGGAPPYGRLSSSLGLFPFPAQDSVPPIKKTPTFTPKQSLSTQYYFLYLFP